MSFKNCAYWVKGAIVGAAFSLILAACIIFFFEYFHLGIDPITIAVIFVASVFLVLAGVIKGLIHGWLRKMNEQSIVFEK